MVALLDIDTQLFHDYTADDCNEHLQARREPAAYKFN